MKVRKIYTNQLGSLKFIKFQKYKSVLEGSQRKIYTDQFNSMKTGDTYLSAYWVIFCYSNGLFAVWCQAITYTNGDLL